MRKQILPGCVIAVRKQATPDTPPRAVITHLELNEISGVGSPAQQPARAVIMKRSPTADSPDASVAVEKGVALTTSEDGHTHLINTMSYDGGEGLSGETSYADGHYHPWVRVGDQIMIGEARGRNNVSHTHTVAVMAEKSATAGDGGDATPTTKASTTTAIGETEDSQMTTTTKTAPDMAEILKRLAVAEARAEMTDVQKSFYAGLTGADADAFVEADSAKRDAMIEAAKSDDPVVYTTAGGVEIRKSDGKSALMMARQLDEQIDLVKGLTSQIATLSEANGAATIEKRAGELMPNTPTAQAIAMVKFIDAAAGDDAEREARTATARVVDNANVAKSTERGAGGAVEAGSPQARLDELAKAHAASAGCSKQQGMAAVLRTEEGRKLYRETRESRVH